MPVNVLLCRWIGGWREVRNEASIAVYGRREALMGLGALQSPQEVDRVASQQLAIFGDPRTAIAADLAPMGTTDRPYRAFNVGDTITVPNYGGGTISERVRALTGAEDDNGEITYSPELGDLILETQERQAQAIKKMSDGTLEGESPVATPVAQTQQAQKVFGGAPFPPSGALRVVATMPNNPYSESSRIYDIGGVADATLVTFRATPQTNGAGDGVLANLYLWQTAGGDGDFEVAVVAMPDNFSAGTTYTGTISDASITFNPSLSYGVFFKQDGYHTGPVHVEAVFAGTGLTYTLTWNASA
jgi:hypothetical protein